GASQHHARETSSVFDKVARPLRAGAEANGVGIQATAHAPALPGEARHELEPELHRKATVREHSADAAFNPSEVHLHRPEASTRRNGSVRRIVAVADRVGTAGALANDPHDQ